MSKDSPQQKWTEVDQYLTQQLALPDEILDACIVANTEEGLPAIDVSPPLGKVLHLLAIVQGARKILEIGTLGGYSSIWLARALPSGGRLTTLEVDRKHAEIARANLRRAGLDAVVDVKVGLALDSLKVLAAAGAGPFDLIFIDADKPNNPHYLEWPLNSPGRVASSSATTSFETVRSRTAAVPTPTSLECGVFSSTYRAIPD